MSNRVLFVRTAIAAASLLVGGASAQTAKPTAATVAPTTVASTTNAPSDRDRDGLVGPVRKIKTEVAKLTTKGGKPAEGAPVLLETAAYDIKGVKVDTAYFPMAGGNLTGRETYKYDDKGNISEMTLLNADGSIMTREVYRYDYDFVGNWTTMTTSVAVIEGGKISYDPTEVTHRTISYFLDDKLTKMMEASQKPAAPVAPANATTGQPKPVTSNTTAGVQPKPTGTTGTPADPNGSQGQAANHVVDTKAPETKPAGTPPVDPNASTKPADANTAAKTADPVAVPPVTDDKSNTAVPSGGDANAATKPVPKPFTKPISGGVLNGAAISLPTPTYPEVARRSRSAGVVVVEVVIDEDGRVIAAKATSGPVMLYNAATDAAKRARFSPTKLSGQPMKVSGTINYNFSLGN
jgi:protein TonB